MNSTNPFVTNIFKLSTLILIILFIFVHSCNTNKINNLKQDIKELTNKPSTVTTDPKKGSTIPSTVSKQDGIIVPKVIYRDTGSIRTIIEYDTIVSPIDTMDIIQKYFSINIFEDSINVEDVIIQTSDTVQGNHIIGRNYLVNNKRNAEFYKKRILYAGGNVAANGTNMLIGPSLNYKTKNDNMFNASYMFSTSGKSYFMFGYSTKISLTKSK